VANHIGAAANSRDDLGGLAEPASATKSPSANRQRQGQDPSQGGHPPDTQRLIADKFEKVLTLHVAHHVQRGTQMCFKVEAPDMINKVRPRFKIRKASPPDHHRLILPTSSW
jgi:hypothetical protein